MSDTLRGTQAGYQRQLDQNALKQDGLKKEIERLEKEKADILAAKKVVDEAVAALPKEPKKPAPAGK